ncbi:hypothetical protein GCM10009127_28370 [Alteraurantiacibacter aestuarii]|uniref:Uncharacterized protein n=1 Tax=Alteraurantiacibacter aestuarii TaxID=650004 RepID=A0A844ZQ76_9SPHN|nr:hypothetical protein [Alteraurantiacibacter aestuarii]MXO88947.1 hypothetical protein [Alteraurantiacibacter aestuarii]
MALDPRDIIKSESLVAELPLAPLAGTRKERMQRLQVGLFGLGAMVLLVGLANIIMSSAQQNQATAVPDALPTAVTQDVPPPPRDPLADAGVVPELPADQGAAGGQAAGASPTGTGDVPPSPQQN